VDLFIAICQGLGLALAAGIGGVLAVLLMSVLAHVDVGWDLDGTDFSWFEAAWFIPILFALNVLVFFLARATGISAEARRGVLIGFAAVFGAIAFGGSLAEETSTWWPGILGAAAGAAAGAVTDSVLAGATARSEETAGTLQLMAAGAGLVLVLVALFIPPASILVAGGLAVLAAGRRRSADQKYEGLRSLR
jgi:FtsH-binding integral membrane protein